MTPNEQFDESMKLAIEKQMSSDTMLPRKEYTPVTRTIEEFMSTNFSKEEYAKLEFLARSRDSSLVQRGEGALNAKLVESFNRKYKNDQEPNTIGTKLLFLLDKIDEEIKNRCTSIYLTDRVLAMIPKKLSNDLCSLNPNTDKLTFSFTF
jgi:hypothetical protein